jgi:preprotein translocase subunit SecG
MESLLLSVNIIIAVLLVVSILLQKSEGGALGLGVSQDNFTSSRSAGNFLTKATGILATLFIIVSLSLTLVANRDLNPISVIDKTLEQEDSSEPEIPKNDE